MISILVNLIDGALQNIELKWEVSEMDKVIIRLDGKKIEVYGNNGEQLTDCASTIRIDKEKTMGTDDKTVVDRITISCIILRPFYPFEDIGD